MGPGGCHTNLKTFASGFMRLVKMGLIQIVLMFFGILTGACQVLVKCVAPDSAWPAFPAP